MTETIEKFEVRNRWTNAVQFTAEISVTPDMTYSVKLGLAVKWGINADANLAGANLAGANLTDANLVRANLADANLADANLADAYLAGANLARANLARANLTDANLTDANLAGAKWEDGVPLTRAPIQMHGLRWPVTILDAHMVIGCQTHRLSDWDAFDDRAIANMDGKHALIFWRAHKETLLGLARADGRDFSAVRAELEKQG